MSEYLVQHRWKQEDTNAVVGVVQKVVQMARANQLPTGFGLRSVHVIAGEPRAVCVWQAPSKSDLEGLIAKMNPPTERVVSELQRMY